VGLGSQLWTEEILEMTLGIWCIKNIISINRPTAMY